MMKKRSRTGPQFRKMPAASVKSAPTSNATGAEPALPAGNVPGLAVVPGPQFAELLAILQRPPEVPVELRRQVADRRWK